MACAMVHVYGLSLTGPTFCKYRLPGSFGSKGPIHLCPLTPKASRGSNSSDHAYNCYCLGHPPSSRHHPGQRTPYGDGPSSPLTCCPASLEAAVQGECNWGLVQATEYKRCSAQTLASKTHSGHLVSVQWLVPRGLGGGRACGSRVLLHIIVALPVFPGHPGLCSNKDSWSLRPEHDAWGRCWASNGSTASQRLSTLHHSSSSHFKDTRAMSHRSMSHAE
jgi:hypothetical protein